ncbi:MAG: hypothetical protein EX254_10050 [Flavobacteriaceae bacterium]|nr:MAG: hypothetical protein EX254_10050 [Flavobacteriaceae bacterium]
MPKLKRLNIFRFAVFQGFLFALLGLLCGILYAFGGLLVDTLVSLGWITTDETPGLGYGSFLAMGAVIGMPIIFAVVGFFGGILEAILFNLVAKLVGGFNIDLGQ